MIPNTLLLKRFNNYFLIFFTLIFLIALVGFIDSNISQFVLHDYKTFIIIVYIASLSIFLFDLITKMTHRLIQDKSLHKKNTQFIHQVKNLKEQEKLFLSLFIDKNALELPFSDKEPALGLLESKKLLISTYQKDTHGKILYRIDPMIFDELKINPNLLF